jgi:hypothetical protein
MPQFAEEVADAVRKEARIEGRDDWIAKSSSRLPLASATVDHWAFKPRPGH